MTTQSLPVQVVREGNAVSESTNTALFFAVNAEKSQIKRTSLCFKKFLKSL